MTAPLSDFQIITRLLDMLEGLLTSACWAEDDDGVRVDSLCREMCEVFDAPNISKAKTGMLDLIERFRSAQDAAGDVAPTPESPRTQDELLDAVDALTLTAGSKAVTTTRYLCKGDRRSMTPQDRMREQTDVVLTAKITVRADDPRALDIAQALITALAPFERAR